MKVTTIGVWGFKGAMIGMRLPMCNSLEEAIEKSDSDNSGIGSEDLKVCKKLVKADHGSFPNGEDKTGKPNAKFLRDIHVQVAVEAPIYWWKEMDTYKVGTTRNSSSTMHKISSRPITKDCFEMDGCCYGTNFEYSIGNFNYDHDLFLDDVIDHLEALRIHHNELVEKIKNIKDPMARTAWVANKEMVWKELIRWLPESWLQISIIDLDYAVLRNMYCWRKNHKLTEWHTFCDWIKTLPYAEELICNDIKTVNNMEKFDKNKLISYLCLDKAEIGKRYYFCDSLYELKLVVENENACCVGKLTDVVDREYSFQKSNDRYWEFIYPYEDKKNQTMK